MSSVGYLGAFYVPKKWAIENTRADASVSALGEADFSIEMWLKITDYTNIVNLISCGDWSVTAGAGLGDVIFTQTGGTTTSSSDLDEDVWYHLVIVRADGANAIYLDGVLDGASATAAMNWTDGDVTIGGTGVTVAMCRIYNYALVESDAALLADGGLTSELYEVMSHEWLFMEGSGDESIDTASDADATLSPDGTTAWTSTYESVVDEAVTVTGLGAQLDNANVDITSLRLYDDGALLGYGRDYTITPAGVITFVAAPDEPVTASYSYWPVVLLGGGFHTWQISESVAEHDVTTFLSTGPSAWVAGLASYTCTASSYWMAPVGMDLPVQQAIIFRAYINTETPAYVTGWGWLTQGTITTDVAAVVEDTFAFRGTEALLQVV